MYHPETFLKTVAQGQRETDRKHRALNVRHERGLSKAHRILLERQGTVWEGSGKKELPDWMKRKDEVVDQQQFVRENLFERAKRWATTVLGILS